METTKKEKRKPRAITKALIEEFLGTEHQIQRKWWGWKIDLLSGASVTLTTRKLDYGRFRELANRKDVCEPLFQMEVRDCIRLSDAIWGGVSFFGKCESKDYAAVLEYAESEGLNTGDQGRTFRHFGAEATIKYGWHSFTINVPERGYVKVDYGAIEKVVGDLMEPTLAMLHEIAPSKVVVRGKPDLMIRAVHCGNTMGISVIPEDPLKLFYGVTANAMVLLCTLVALLKVDLGYALLIGYVVGIPLCMLGGRLFWKQLRDAGRKRGLEIVQPEHFSKSRKASEDAARRRDMI